MLDRLIDIAVRRRIAVLVLAVGFVLFGIRTFAKLKIEAFPDVTNVQVMVITLYPGQAAEEVEKQVTIPVERALFGCPNVLVQRSITSFGLSQVIVTFEDDTDIYFARTQVAERLRDADVPDGVTPTLGPNDTPVGQIYQYTLQSDAGHTPSEMRSWQEWEIEKQLKRVPGVADVVSFGGFIKELHVVADPGKLKAANLALKDLSDAINQSNAATSGGYLPFGESEFVVRGRGYLKSAEDVAKTVVAVQNGTPITVGKLAKVVEGFTPRRGTVARNGEIDSVEGTILLRRGENPKDVLDALHEAIDHVNKDVLPKGMKIVPFYDRTRLVDTTLHTVSHNMIEGAALVTLVLWLFLRAISGSIAVAVTMPLALLTAFVGLYYAGVPANLLSMGAIDFGILLDGAVILVENSYRHLGEEQAPPEEVPHVIARAAKEVVRPTLFSMSIIVAAMMPIFTLERVEGRIFRPVALTYAFALGGALLFTLTVVPALTTVLLQKRKVKEVDPAFLVFLRKRYLAALKIALDWPITTRLGALVILVVAIYLVPKLGTEFLPQMNEGDIHITVTMPSETSLERGQQVLKETRLALLEFPEVQDVVNEQGHPEDGTDDEAPNQAETFVIMKPENEWHTGRTKDQIVDLMREKLEERPGVEYNFSQPIKDRVEESISGIRGQVVVKIYGEDLSLMQDKLEQVRRIFNTTKGARDVEVYRAGTAQHIVADIDRDAIARVGLQVQDVESVLESAYGGHVATSVWEGERKVPVRVKLPAPDEGDQWTVGKLDIPAGSARIPLSQLAKVHIDQGRTQINREQGGRFLALKGNIEGRDMGSFVAEVQKRVEKEVPLPEGYYITWSGEFENQQRAMHRLMVIVPISVAVIFLLLYFAFGAALPAIVVLLDVPFATVGGIFALYFTHTVLSVSAAVGFITLFGVAVMDGVLLITYVRQARLRHGEHAQQAILEAVSQRLRPVLMTALLASLGLLPAALSKAIGSDTQRPFAIVIIGGLISSTLLTMLLLPTLYELFERWFGGSKGRPSQAPQGPHGNGHAKKIGAAAAVALALFALPRDARGADMTMDQAVAVALQRNRDVIAAKMDIEAAQLDKVAASVYPNPTLSYSLSNIVLGKGNPQSDTAPINPGPFSQTIHTIGITEIIDVWNKRGTRIEAADKAIDLKKLQVEDALREIVYNVRSAAADLLREQSEDALAHEIQSRYSETVRISRARKAAGEISEADLKKIELEGMKYDAEVIDADGELATARAKLAALMGVPASAADQITLTEPSSPRAPLDLNALTKKAFDQRPDVRANKAAKAYAAASLTQAKREALPDISLGVAYTHDAFTISGDNPNTLSLSLSFPLPIFDRNQAAIGKARLEMRKSDNEAAKVALTVEHEVAEAQRAHERARKLLDLYENGMIERADSALKVAEKSYKAGAISLLELLEAQRAYLETRADYLKAKNAYHQARVDVAHAVGGNE